MNNKNFVYIFFIFIFSYITLFPQPVKSDSSLFPLAIGNKYIYFIDNVPVDFYTGYGNHSYSIDTYEITSTLTYNKIQFYKIYEMWLGLDKLTNNIYQYVSAGIYSFTEVYLSLSPLGPLSYQSFLGSTYPSYQYTNTFFGGPGSITRYNYYYAYNIGLGYQIIENRTSHGSNDEYMTLIGMISNDPDNPFLKQDEAVPVISPPISGILPDSNRFFINTTISHKFSYETNYLLKIARGCSFIGQAELEYFYKKDNDTLNHNFENLRMSTEKVFGRLINIRKDLIQKGYDIYYRIKAVDKALKPHITYYPETGFNKLEFDEYFNINYYPLAVGNKWIYNINDLSKKSTSSLNRMEVTVIGETTLGNNKKYFIVQRNDIQQYERIDTLSGIVYTANTTDPNNIIEYRSNYLYAKTGEDNLMLRNNLTKKYFNNNSSITTFNTTDVPAKIFSVADDTSFTFTLAKNIGVYSEKYKTSEKSYLAELIYAKIGDTEYGKNILPMEILKKYPIHVGDRYTYARSTKSYTPNVFIPYDTLTVSVDKDTILSNNQKYFKLVSKEEDLYVRIDSTDGNIYNAKIIDGNVTELLIDNIVAEDNSVLNIYFSNNINQFRYNKSTYSNPVIGQNRECITARQVDNENIYFIRCDNYGIISSCTRRNSTEGIIYLYQDLIDVSTTINGLPPASPTSYNLSQNYPNPFNPSTNINFTLPNAEFVTLKIYDILGKVVTTLINEELNAGNYTKTWDANNLSSGVYFYRLTAGKFTETKKMILVR